jgi:ssDNA thymidine ADP-ribosyltransferase, DarT
MMYRVLCDQVPDLVVVRVSSTVLDLPGTVITDGNAAADTTRFLASPYQLHELIEEYIYAQSWNDPDPFRKIELKRRRCAEILVPDAVPPTYIRGCYTKRREQAIQCRQLVPIWQIEVNSHVFFE